jgi:adhesin transport system membrane fusion protein
MTATVEIKTGRKSVLQYLTKPIVKTLNESLGER